MSTSSRSACRRVSASRTILARRPETAAVRFEVSTISLRSMMASCDSGRSLEGFTLLLHCSAAPAAFDVIVDESHCLHERINGCGADKGPSALLEVPGQGLRLRRSRHRHQGSAVEAVGP